MWTIRTVSIALIVTCYFVSPAFPECVEYKIIDHGDSVEAVCVGAPLTPEEQRLLSEEEKREKQRVINQMKMDQKRENARIAEDQREQEKRLKEQKVQEQKAADSNRPPQRSSGKSDTRLENARQKTLR